MRPAAHQTHLGVWPGTAARAILSSGWHRASAGIIQEIAVATEAVQSIDRTAPEAEAPEAVQHLVSLLEEGRIEEARRLAPQLVTRFPDSHALAKLAEALEPPRVL